MVIAVAAVVAAGVVAAGGSGGGGDNGGGAGQSPYPLQAFCNSSILLCLETHFFTKIKKTLKNS